MLEPSFIARIVGEITPGAVGIWTGVFMFAAYLVREWRETRKLSADDRLARREGYAAQVTSLTKENRDLRVEMGEMRRAHEDYRKLCHAETDQLRRQVVTLEDTVTGLQRQLTQEAISIGRELRKGVVSRALDVPQGKAK